MHKGPDIFLTGYHLAVRFHSHKSVVDGSGPLMEMYEVVRWPDCSPSSEGPAAFKYANTSSHVFSHP